MQVRKLVVALFGVISALVVSTSAQAQSPFTGLVGTWSGSGQIRLENGASESIRCNAYYTNRDEGAGLGIALRCASQSYKIELRSKLNSQGGHLSGQWEERTFNASGSVSGKAAGGKIDLSVVGGGFSGSMAVNTSGSSQTVAINTSGIGLKSVSISLSRSS